MSASLQQIFVLILVIAASFFLVRRGLRSSNKGGCTGCGCSKKGKDQAETRHRASSTQ